ncbi:hypothetical protein ACH4F6_31640 [Streptomyces sp. NPDC017936]|uniref:hypothetical protein n=1 Tax=Streptomyces sp. NPDC017936 TaxID=3365016 RepID=UPI00379D7603
MTDPRCDAARLLGPLHAPHEWSPDPDAAPVHCPGGDAHDAGPSVREAAADDRRWWDGEKTGER